MELISNLAWSATIVVLLAIWITGQRPLSRASLLPAIGIQIIAFTMAAFILLPAISVTDDLHACAMPAEVERSCGWNHRMLAAVQAPHNLPVGLALLASSLRPARLRRIATLSADESMPFSPQVFDRTLWSRPPPSA